MSRSQRRSPVTGITTAESEKADKILAHKRERRKVTAILQSDMDPQTLPHRRELSNPWAMDKDGKARFDPQRHPQLMRK